MNTFKRAALAAVLLLLAGCAAMQPVQPTPNLSADQIAAAAKDNKTITSCTLIQALTWSVRNVTTISDQSKHASSTDVKGADCSTVTTMPAVVAP